MTDDTMVRLLRLRERGALNPETEAVVLRYLRRREAIQAGRPDPGPTPSPTSGARS